MAFDFRPPMLLASISSGNLPTTGGITLSLVGSQFGVFDNSARAKVGSTRCESTRWVSQTLVLCRAPAGQGVNHDVSVWNEVSEPATLIKAIQYNAPRIINATPSHGPVVNSVFTIAGSSFGTYSPGFINTTSSMFVNATRANVTWVSDSSLVVALPPTNLAPVALTGFSLTMIGRVLPVPGTWFSYDLPSVTSFTPSIGQRRGGFRVTIAGANFGQFQQPASKFNVKFGSVLCDNVTWTSDSSLACVSPPGKGVSKPATITRGVAISTPTKGLFFNLPLVTSLFTNATRWPGVAGDRITIRGNDFGSDATSWREATIGGKTCTTTRFLSDTSVVCTIPAGSGKMLNVSVSVDNRNASGTLAHAFTYDAPVVTSLSASMGPTTGFPGLVIYGSSFGSEDEAAPTVRIGSTACTSVLWTSESQVTCAVPAGNNGISANVPVSLTQGGQSAASSVAFKYVPPPVITAIDATSSTPSLYSATGGMISIYGYNFTSSEERTIRIGQASECREAEWVSDTYVTVCFPCLPCALLFIFALEQDSARIFLFACTCTCSCLSTITNSHFNAAQCKVPRGLGVNLPVSLSANNGLAVLEKAFNYTAPILKLIAPVVPSTTGAAGVSSSTVAAGTTITVFGEGFGSLDSSPRTRVGSTMCAETRWQSDSSLTCMIVAGTGVSLRITTTIALAEASLAGVISYPLPTLASSVPNGSAIVLPTAGGGQEITVTGQGFGQESSPPGYSIRVGQTVCSPTMWDSETQLRCAVPKGIGKDLPISIVAPGGANVTLTGQAPYKYAFPVVTALSSASGPASGRANITVFGNNFGAEDMQGQRDIRVGATWCMETYWVSDSALQCKLPKGALAGLSVVADVSGQVSQPLENAFGFVSPSCSAIANMEPNAATGEFLIDPRGDGDVFKVYCNMDLERAGVIGRLGNLSAPPALWMDSSIASDFITSGADGDPQVSLLQFNAPENVALCVCE